MSDFNFKPEYGDMLTEIEDRENGSRKRVPQKSYTNALHTRKNYDDYLFRCHSFGRLMGGIPKPLSESQRQTYDSYHDRFMGIGKELTEKQEATYFDLGAKLRAKVQLADGAKTYCEELVREDIFGRRKFIETKYFEKGIEMEDASIALYSMYTGIPMKKNTERKQNAYWIGECDEISDKVRDFKTSWDHSTFPRTDQEIKNKIYAWQLQLYMDLWGKDEAELVYTLVDTPTRLVEDEIRRLDWKYNILSVSGYVEDKHIPFVVEKVSNMVYTIEGLEEVCSQSGTIEIEWFDEFIELSIEDRVKVFELQKCEKTLQQGRDMVVLAREYMNSIR